MTGIQSYSTTHALLTHSVLRGRWWWRCRCPGCAVWVYKLLGRYSVAGSAPRYNVGHRSDFRPALNTAWVYFLVQGNLFTNQQQLSATLQANYKQSLNAQSHLPILLMFFPIFITSTTQFLTVRRAIFTLGPQYHTSGRLYRRMRDAAMSSNVAFSPALLLE